MTTRSWALVRGTACPYLYSYLYFGDASPKLARLDAAAKPSSDAAAPLPTFSIGADGARLCCDGGLLSAPHAGARTRAEAYNASDKGKAYNTSDKAKAAKSAPLLRPQRCARLQS